MRHFLKATWMLFLLLPFCAGQSKGKEPIVSTDPTLECHAKVLRFALERRLVALEADTVKTRHKHKHLKVITAHDAIQ